MLRKPDGSEIPAYRRISGRQCYNLDQLKDAICPYTKWGNLWYQQCKKEVIDYDIWYKDQVKLRAERIRKIREAKNAHG